MFKLLMYLFENYMDGSVALNADPDTIIGELEMAGFQRNEISMAFDWLDGLNRVQESVLSSIGLTQHSIRYYMPEEQHRLGLNGMGFLLYLQQLGILDPNTREIVIDRLMALDHRDVDMGGIKWVVLLVLFNQPDKKSALSLLQDMILSETFNVLH